MFVAFMLVHCFICLSVRVEFEFISFEFSLSQSREKGEIEKNPAQPKAKPNPAIQPNPRPLSFPSWARAEVWAAGSWVGLRGFWVFRVLGFQGGLGWARLGLGSFLLSSFLFKPHSTNLNSNSNLNSTLTLNQIKLCTSMYAQQVSPKINFIYLRIKIRLNVSLNTINLRNLIKVN